MNVPGRKTMPRIEIVFIAEESRWVSNAIVLMTALSSLLASAMIVEVSARLRFVLASFAAINWYTFDSLISNLLNFFEELGHSLPGSRRELCFAQIPLQESEHGTYFRDIQPLR